MAFNSAVQANVQNVDGGELLVTAPYAVTSYDSFQDGLKIGRIAQIKAGVVSNLDGTSTPDICGVVRRDVANATVAGETISADYSLRADVVDFGRVTVFTATGAVPTEGSAVYVINNTSADAGKVTQNSSATGALALTDVVFYKEVKAGVWTVTLKKFIK
jgi:hypothetical protein